MPLGPSVEVSSGDGEGDIRMVCNDKSGIYVGRLRGRGRTVRGLSGSLWIMRVAIARQVSVADVTRLSRANRVRPLKCPWPAVAECPLRLQPRSSVGIPPGGSRPGVGQVPLGEWEERRGYVLLGL